MELISDLPLYEAIKRALKTRIENGELPEGSRILPEIELARQLNVSRSTARKALQLLELEGYLSRRAGRGSFVRCPAKQQDRLSGKGTMAITVFHLGQFNHPGLLVQGFMNQAVSRGFHASVHPPLVAGEDDFEYLLNVRRSGINGWALWIMNPNEKNLSLLRNFQKPGYGLVLVDRYVREMPGDFVVTDNERMAYQLTRELIRRGHRDIGMISFPLDCTLSNDRLAGYTRALLEADLPFQEDLLVVDQIQGIEALRMQILSLLSRRQRPTAVFCATEHHTSFLLKEVERLSYRVPDDIELAFVDENRLAEHLAVPAIWAAQRSYEMGQRAADMLERRLNQPDAPWQQVLLEFDLSFSPVA